MNGIPTGILTPEEFQPFYHAATTGEFLFQKGIGEERSWTTQFFRVVCPLTNEKLLCDFNYPQDDGFPGAFLAGIHGVDRNTAWIAVIVANQSQMEFKISPRIFSEDIDKSIRHGRCVTPAIDQNSGSDRGGVDVDAYDNDWGSESDKIHAAVDGYASMAAWLGAPATQGILGFEGVKSAMTGSALPSGDGDEPCSFTLGVTQFYENRDPLRLAIKATSDWRQVLPDGDPPPCSLSSDQWPQKPKPGQKVIHFNAAVAFDDGRNKIVVATITETNASS
jgi:hypothetical protein